jgi:hypothetical protein
VKNSEKRPNNFFLNCIYIKLEKTEETLKNEQCRDNLNNGLKRQKLKRNKNKATHTSQHKHRKLF